MQQTTNNTPPRNLLLVVMGQSPFNRSIWTGFMNEFQALGHNVRVVDARRLPDPATLGTLPDLLFAVHGSNVPVEQIQAYRERGVTTAVYLLDEPYEIDRSTGWSRHYDCVFSVDRITVPAHARFTRAAYLPLAYNRHIFRPDGPRLDSRILVLGTPFKAREAYLATIRDRWGDLVTWVGPGWKAFSDGGRHYEGFVEPEHCAAFYRGADIVINIHRDSCWSHFGDLNSRRLEATHLNPRFWESAGCGTFQLCSYRSDLDLYAPAAIAFNDLDDLVDKLDYFLDNTAARQRLASQLYSKVRNHTYEQRARTVLEFTGVAPA
jgi:spore maturation protein CgeB